jgi:hypothetical protein
MKENDMSLDNVKENNQERATIAGQVKRDSKLRGRRLKMPRITLTAFVALLALVGSALVAGAGSAARTSAPGNTSLPKIQGTAEEGETLTATAGSWSGSQPITFKGQWKQCAKNGTGCAAILGATDADYKLRTEDVGHTIRITVTATNNDGSSQATSQATAVVKAAAANAPTNTSAPTISGTAKEGQTLTADKGAWNGSQPIDYKFQWQRCDKNGLSCANIGGAAKTTYVLGSADVGNTVRVRVNASNKAGQTTAFSQPSGVVASSTNPPPPPPPGGTIPVSQVNPPERLLIAQASFNPAVIRSRSGIETIRIKIMDTKGHLVSGALVLATPLPYVWASAPAETVSGAGGIATVQFRIHSIVPRKAAIVVFIRARKPGDNVLTGVSSRRLVQVLVNIG